MAIRQATAEELKIWDEALCRQGLSMNAGHDPQRVTYGWRYLDGESTEPFDYSLFYKPADRRGGRREGAGRKRGR